MGLLRCLIRVMSEHREEQGSTIPKMSNSRHILLLAGLSRNRCAHSRQEVSSFSWESPCWKFPHAKPSPHSELFTALQPGATELQEQGCAAGAALGQPRTGKWEKWICRDSQNLTGSSHSLAELCANSEMSCAASGRPWNRNPIVEREMELETSSKRWPCKKIRYFRELELREMLCSRTTRGKNTGDWC